MKKGKLIILSAPSGSGKTTLVHHLLKQNDLNLSFSISATSREARGSEKDGEDYYFMNEVNFDKAVSNDDFIEWEEVYKGNKYGTLRSEVERIWAKGGNVIFDIDVVGGLNIKKQFPKEALAIFVKPPSLEVMEQRLRARKTDTEEKIQERVAKSSREMDYACSFDAILINDNLDIAKGDVINMVNDFLK
ncbi:MAG: guanylate kinase [Flavobacteriaceae bacterium]|nr:guanylate kinase [Flavobacteriaceae bacterium]